MCSFINMPVNAVLEYGVCHIWLGGEADNQSRGWQTMKAACARGDLIAAPFNLTNVDRRLMRTVPRSQLLPDLFFQLNLGKSLFLLLSADLISEMRESCAFSAEIVAFLVDRLRMLEHALLVEQALASVTLAALGQTSADSTPEPPEALLKKNQELLSVFSSRLTQKGPIKRIDLPSDPEIAEKVKRAVFDLHLLLEDLYADMPGLPAALVCDGVDFAQPRFFTDSALSQPAARQPLAPSHLECHSPPPPEPSPSDPSCGPVPAQPPPTALLSPPAVDTTTVIEISDSD
uniref:DUF1086 domain-containing protein n=1 Tax=Mesocestoides corti TaxID=53468 RepID=A0A5K3FTV8_MESCO